MKRLPRPLLFSLLLLPLSFAPAATLTGSFDFTGSTFSGGFESDELTGTATFTYDTGTNLGTIHDFYWLGGTLSDFQFAVFPNVYNGFTPPPTVAEAGNYAFITDFADLTNFGTRSHITTGIGGGQLETYYNDWYLFATAQSRTGSIRGADWGYFGSNLINPPLASGSSSNFQPTPEPAGSVLVAFGALILAASRNAINSRS